MMRWMRHTAAVVEGSGWTGTDDSLPLSPSLLWRVTRLHIPRARPSLALEAAFSPVAALAHDQPSTPTYSRPCTPRAPLIGSAQPACLRCVAALEQQPTIASSRRLPPHQLHNPIYTQSPSLPRTIPTTLLPSPLHVDIIHSQYITPSLRQFASSITHTVPHQPCTFNLPTSRFA
jgi:hypothetical protein